LKDRQQKIQQPLNPGQIVLGLLLVFVCLAPTGNLRADELAVPAEFIRDIKLPGFGETILRPSALHYDRFHYEILVGDSGNNRILIFSSGGIFKFSFSLTEIMTTPRDITTDPQGFIYILGSDPRGQVLYRFDFDGAPLGVIDIPRVLAGVPVELRYLACDDKGTLFALDHRGRRVLVIGEDDALASTINLERDVELAAELSEDDSGGKGAYALGTMACAGNTLYIPVSNVGTVHTYSTDGEYLGSIGYFGSKPGTLNFPVAVEVSPDGLIMVLDRNRYCVVCYSADKKFLGEFGGKGISPGWFMGPSLLSVPSADRAVIGQLFRNKIQVCAVPEFIRAKAGHDLNEQAAAPEHPDVSVAAANPDVATQRRLSDNSRPVHLRDGEFPSSDFNNSHDANTVSYPEVSE
jgi:hypothetical protein